MEGRPAGDWIPEVTGIHRNRQWDITSDGPDSATSGSDIPEGHYDRPPEEEYSDIPTSRRPHVGYVAERLCSPIGQLEKAVVRLQWDMTDHRTELRLRTQTPDPRQTLDSVLRTAEEENLVMPKYGRPYDRRTMFSNWSTGENSGPAAAGHCRLPCGAQNQ